MFPEGGNILRCFRVEETARLLGGMGMVTGLSSVSRTGRGIVRGCDRLMRAGVRTRSRRAVVILSALAGVSLFDTLPPLGAFGPEASERLAYAAPVAPEAVAPGGAAPAAGGAPGAGKDPAGSKAPAEAKPAV